MLSLPGDSADDTPQPFSAAAPSSGRVPFTRATVAAFAAVDARRLRSDWDFWRLQSNSLGHCKVANSYPEAEKKEIAELLAHLTEVVMQARQARGNRTQLRAPTPPRKAGHRSLFARMNWHLRRLARRALDEWFIHGHDAPAVDDLAAALAAYVWAEHGKLIHYREPGGDPLGRSAPRWLAGDDAVRRVAASAAGYALRRWNPLDVMRRQLASAAGGRRSRRGASKVTVVNLGRLRDLQGLTAAQQARELDCSERTIYAMRAQLRGE